MTPAKQLFRHDPANGVMGDCYRTAIACLLDRPPESVPHFLDSEEVTGDQLNERMRAWLAGEGYVTIQIGLVGDLATVMAGMKRWNPGVYYLLTGESPRGTNHVVIALDDEIVHDPHPDGGGLAGPDDSGTIWIEMLVPTRIHVAAKMLEAAE